MESELNQIELSVESDPWNTIWLISKTLYESEKRRTPVKIEVRSGSVESTIFVAAGLAEIGAFAIAIVRYIRSRRKKDKPLKIIKYNREMAYAVAKYILLTQADVPQSRLIEEHPTSDGGYFFKFETPSGEEHNFSFDSEFRMTYDRSNKLYFT